MDWTFYLIVFGVLFGLFVLLLTVRVLVGRRLERLEKERQTEEDARQTAKSNSGL